jgi:hypothetical protein
MDPRNFVMLLQFLTYAQELDFEMESFGGISDRQLILKAGYFLEFQNPRMKLSNDYQLEVRIKVLVT